MEISILVTKPKTLNATDKKVLRDAGVIVVEAVHTEGVRLLRPTSDLGHSDMLFAAMEAIMKSDASKREFSDRVAAMVKVAHEQSGA